MGGAAAGAGGGAMVGGPWGAVVGGGLGLIGDIAGGAAAGADRGHSRGLTDEAIAALNGVSLPTDIANRIYFQNYINAGNLNPALEQAIQGGPSAEGQVKANPQLVAAQMQALGALHNLSQTGMTSADRARLNQIQQQAATQAEGQRQAVLQNFAQRGMGGSGNELLAQLQASQNAANQANQGSLNVAANAQQNALNALGQFGQQAGQINQQQFGQQSQAAQAQDLLNRFNVQNQTQQQARNVGAQNAAQQFNLQNQQAIQNANIGQQNQEMIRQKNAQQQLFQDAIQRAGGMAQADMSGANAYNNYGNQAANQWSNIGHGAGNIFSGLYNSGNQKGSLDDEFNRTTFAHGGEVPGYNHGGEACMMAGGFAPGYQVGGNVTGNTGPQNFNPLLGPAPSHQNQNMPMLTALASRGGKVPGQAKVKGDSPANDIIKARLSPGEFVIPRTVMQSQDPGENAKKMIELHLNCNPEFKKEE